MPALNAVLFMQPRRSLVDVVQAVGRVMRRAPNKKYGYIILPIVIPTGVDPKDALDDNERYRVVWEVLQALRSHDERLDAEINKIDLQRTEGTGRINVIGVGSGENDQTEQTLTEEVAKLTQYQLPGLFINDFRAKVVEKVGDRQYWDRWAKDVADIHDRLETRIAALIPVAGSSNNGALTQVRLRFESLTQAMRATTNEALTEEGAVSIVAQHMITEPVFQALFEGHDFAKSNPVAASLNQFVSLIKQHGLNAELEQLEPFYASVKRRAEGLDNAEARRKVLEELYENFFRNALPKEAQRLGVVYTPHEIVDFILKSADFLLRKEFGKSLSDEGVHVLDPFAGMGTFMWRLLANPDLIRDEDLERKFWEELHANEILPLAYYMASVNVEEAFRERIETRDKDDPGYLAFEGMVWRDTFNAMTEGRNQQPSMQFMQDNDKRAGRQDDTDIGVIVGNPPYSSGQSNANDANPNVVYPSLNDRIRNTYSKRSRVTNQTSLFDHYKMAIRWGTDRLTESGGIIGLVTNASFLDGNADSGLRACLAEEFSSIYVFDLRGKARTSGEMRRKEKDNVFGQGTRTPVAITLFVKNPHSSHIGCEINYLDIGDYLTRQEKLTALAESHSVASIGRWFPIKPDQNFDWINLRDPSYASNAPLGDESTKRGSSRHAIFGLYSPSVKTNRDDWMYGFSRRELVPRVSAMTDYYLDALSHLDADHTNLVQVTSPNPNRIKWERELTNRFKRGAITRFDTRKIRPALYRPFVKHFLYYEPLFIAVEYRTRSMFPISGRINHVISVHGVGSSKQFSTIVTDTTPDIQALFNGQHFPRFTFVVVDGGIKGPKSVTHTQVGLSNISVNEFDSRRISMTSAPNMGTLSSTLTANSSLTDLSCPDPRTIGSDMRCSCGNTMPCGVEMELDGLLYIRHDNILDEALEAYQSNYDDASITKDDIFYYVYGLLHSPLYKERYHNNLRRELPRIPLAPDFWAFSKAGRALSDLHLNYETCEEYPLSAEPHFSGEPEPEHYQLGTRKMRWTSKESKVAIRVNDYFTLGNIPPDAHRYVVNGRTPLEWIIDRYHVKTDKPSGIVHDPNKWFEETGDNIVSMIKRITHTSIESIRVIDTLPTPFTDGWTPD